MSKSGNLDLGQAEKTVTTAGTRERLANDTEVLSVTIKALSTNTGKVYVGDNEVSSSNGFPLNSRDTLTLEVADPSKQGINLNQIFIDVGTSGEGVRFIYLRD